MKNIYKSWDENLFNTYIRDFKLKNNKPIKNLSKGMRKKLEIITALSHHPKLLILDEPTSGLDPVVRSEVLDLFLKFVKDDEHTILLSTHITTDLEHVADQIIFIDNGKIEFISPAKYPFELLVASVQTAFTVFISSPLLKITSSQVEYINFPSFVSTCNPAAIDMS